MLAIVSLVAVFTTRVSRKMPDFEVYRTAGARALAAEPLYRADDGHFQFKYLPAFAVFAAPLAMVPAPAAKGAWFAMSAVLMLVLLGLSLRAMPEVHRPPAVLVVVTFLAMAKFYAHELVLGQVNLLFAVLVVLAIVWMRSGRDAAAPASLLALAVVVKPYAVIFAAVAGDAAQSHRVPRDDRRARASCCCCRRRATAGTATCGCSATGGRR